jgi:hypothetical protein
MTPPAHFELFIAVWFPDLPTPQAALIDAEFMDGRLSVWWTDLRDPQALPVKLELDPHKLVHQADHPSGTPWRYSDVLRPPSLSAN